MDPEVCVPGFGLVANLPSLGSLRRISSVAMKDSPSGDIR